MDGQVSGKSVVPLSWRGIFISSWSPLLLDLYKSKRSGKSFTAFFKRVVQGEDALYWITALFYDCQLQGEHALALTIWERAGRCWPEKNWNYVLRESLKMQAAQQMHTLCPRKAKRQLRRWAG